MAMGMTYDEYWNGEPEIARFVRKAYLFKLEEQNRQHWMMGRYVYDAIFANAPVLRAFSSATSPKPYVDEPYPVTLREYTEREDQKEREEQMRIQADIRRQITAANKAIRSRKE